MNMDIKTIAKNNQVSERFVRFLVSGERFTDIPFLAKDIAAMTGEKPIQYIRAGRRKLFKTHMPELNRKVSR